MLLWSLHKEDRGDLYSGKCMVTYAELAIDVEVATGIRFVEKNGNECNWDRKARILQNLFKIADRINKFKDGTFRDLFTPNTKL